MNWYKMSLDYIAGYNPIITNNQGMLSEEYHHDTIDDSRLSMEYEFNQDYIDDYNRIKDELDCSRNVNN